MTQPTPNLTALQHLPPEWQQWLLENLARQVPPESLAKVLAENGMSDACQALADDFGLVPQSSLPRPFVDVSHNRLTLPDAEPQVIFACDSPEVVVLDNFITAEECAQLIALAEGKVEDATVVDPATGEFVKHQDRTSMNAVFSRAEHPLIARLEARIAAAIHWPAENGEGMQVLRYRPGGEYKAHFDYFDTQSEGGRKNMQTGGQRVGTFLMYLCDVEAGGATRFPALNFEIRPKKGMALFFANTLPNGEGNPLTLHSGVPVVSGVKYLASKWLREKPY